MKRGKVAQWRMQPVASGGKWKGGDPRSSLPAEENEKKRNIGGNGGREPMSLCELRKNVRIAKLERTASGRESITKGAVF